MMRRIALFALATFLVAGTAAAEDYKVGDLQIVQPWSRATPKGARVGGGYLTIKNTGKTEDRLVAVSAPDASDNVQLHEMAVKNGVMTMAALPKGLAIPPGATVEFKPGSYHVMFIDLKHQLIKGEHVKARLTFEHAGTVDVDFDVEGIGAASPGHDMHNMGTMSH